MSVGIEIKKKTLKIFVASFRLQAGASITAKPCLSLYLDAIEVKEKIIESQKYLSESN